MCIRDRLFAGKSYDTDVQSVRENQIVIYDGPYSMRRRMVVAGIEHTQSGYNYRLIDPETAEEHSADLIRPLRDKFGIGHYYDDEHPEFLDAAEVAALRTRADALKAEQEAARRAAAEDAERLRIIGAERLRQIVPDDAMAVIIGEQHESECNPYTDYFGSRIVRTVILGFSTHTRDLFPEMRKAAARFEGTARFLADLPARIAVRAEVIAVPHAVLFTVLVLGITLGQVCRALEPGRGLAHFGEPVSYTHLSRPRKTPICGNSSTTHRVTA